LPVKNRHNIVKALICYSRYCGEYDKFKARLKSHGVKWSSGGDALNAFLHIFNNNHMDLPRYLKEVQPHLNQSEQTYVEFLAMTGLRAGEACTAFNLIIKLHGEGRLGEYYNQALNCLEHYKHRGLFLRQTKNCYISFVPQPLVDRICRASPVDYNKIQCRFKRRGLLLQFKHLRSYHNSSLRKAGVLPELVDILAGRVPKSVFVRHYLAADLQQLSGEVLTIQESLEKALFG
jgi:intergrase/recombinase